MKIKLTKRNEYELYISKLVAKNIKMSVTVRKLVIELAIQAFDDGMLFNQNRLTVEVAN